MNQEYEAFIKKLAGNLRRDNFRRVNDAIDPVKIVEDLQKKEEVKTEFIPIMFNDVITGDVKIIPGSYLFYIEGYDFDADDEEQDGFD